MTTVKSVNTLLREKERPVEKHLAGRRSRVSVVSLNDKQVVNSIFREIGHSTAAHQSLRREIFRQVAKSTKLQHMFLDVLSRHSEIQNSVFRELAKNPRLKGKFVVVAHEEKKGTSARKNPKSS